MTKNLRLIYNGRAIALGETPRLSPDDFLQTLGRSVGQGWRVVSYFAMPEKEDSHTFCCVLAYKVKGQLGVMATEIRGKRAEPEAPPAAFRSVSSPRTTGNTRAASSSASTSTEPGREDAPPTSSTAAPWAVRARAWAKAVSGVG